MRTNIDLDDDLITEALRLTEAKTKKEVVHTALRELVESRKRLDMRDLRGSVKLRADYDYKALREGIAPECS